MTDEKPDKPLVSQHQATTFNRLRRLQEHILSNIPAMITQRWAGAFTLQKEAIPHEARNNVSVVVYPQNPFVGEPEVRSMNAADIQPGLVNSRMYIQNKDVSPAQPDADGNYLYWPDTPEFAEVNSFYYTNFTLRMVEHYAHRAIPWAFPMPRITINPHVGEGANAFYSEQDRLLGFHSFATNGETVHTAHNADIVSHEAAHAILDGLRDLYNESFGLGPAAFHESFGDMIAVLVALHDDSLVRRLLELTGGNLRVDNFITAMAEHLTDRLQQGQSYMPGHTVYLRNALNTLTFQPFDTLPYLPENPTMSLGRESHNYSRLFTGAFYDILVSIYELLSKTTPRHIALHKARDIAGNILTCAVELGPVGELDFSDMAKAFLTAERVLYNGQYVSNLTDTFAQRGILSHEDAEAFLKTSVDLPDIRLPQSLNTSLESALFLEEQIVPVLGLPANELTPLVALRNASGNAYLTYFSSRHITLNGKEFNQFDGAIIDAFGGLTLMFNAEGRLSSVFYRPVTDEDVRQIRILTAELIQFGLIVQSTQSDQLPLQKPLYAQPNTPRLLSLPGFDWSRPEDRPQKLVKYPVIFDSVPKSPTSLRDYLQTWLERHRLQ